MKLTDRTDETSLFYKGFNKFVDFYNLPGYDFNLNVARIFVCAFMIWKLLSRDFGFFGSIPEEVFYYYPYEIYPADKWILWTGIPVFQEILTFHWLHWILPHPPKDVLRAIQATAIVLLCLLGIFGKGHKGITLIATYIVLIYLWGYLILLGQEIDSVDLYFGMLIALGIGKYSDLPVWNLGKLYKAKPSIQGGRSYSNLMLVIIFYYFASGTKKLTDLSLTQWFDYDLIEMIEQHTIVAAKSPLFQPEFFKIFHGLYFLDYVLPPAVYISHLLTPIVFFRRTLILKFFVFYCIFHLMTFGVGISFTGYIVIWSAIFPWRDIFQRIIGFFNKLELLCRK